MITVYASNCYSLPSRLYVIGGLEIKEREGTTQGEPIAISVYAIMSLMLMELEFSLKEHAGIASEQW